MLPPLTTSSRQRALPNGTSDLHFSSKDEIVTSVADRLITNHADQVEGAITNAHLTPLARIMALGRALTQVARQAFERDLIEIIHRSENRAMHDRMTEQAMSRLRPTLAGVIADGIAAGQFRPQDPRLAAAFVLGTFTQLHDVVEDPDEMPSATAALHTFVLRGLGYSGEIQSDV